VFFSKTTRIRSHRAKRRIHASGKRCPFSCYLNSP